MSSVDFSFCRLRGVADDRFAATALPLRLIELSLSFRARSGQPSLRSDCPDRALSQAGAVTRPLIMLVLRDTADTSCAVTAVSLRSFFLLSPLSGALAFLGRRTAGIS
ncbi:MAG: hypothetical protein WCW53_03745 [Syntrophales bacterium]